MGTGFVLSFSCCSLEICLFEVSAVSCHWSSSSKSQKKKKQTLKNLIILAVLCSVQDLSSPTKDWPRAPAVEEQSLNRWAAREPPHNVLSCLPSLNSPVFAGQGFRIPFLSIFCGVWEEIECGAWFNVPCLSTTHPVCFTAFACLLPSITLLPLF